MLLQWAELDFEVRVHPTDESYPAGMSCEDVPVYIAANKAAATRCEPDELLIAADTVVVLDGEIIGKPRDRNEAIEFLSRLSGRQHRVITGVVIRGAEHDIRFSDVSEVEFHALDRQQIAYYVDRYEPFDKAGAYAIQEWIGVVGIRRISGDFYNVMGLPVSRVVQELRKTGFSKT